MNPLDKHLKAFSQGIYWKWVKEFLQKIIDDAKDVTTVEDEVGFKSRQETVKVLRGIIDHIETLKSSKGVELETNDYE